MQRVSSLGPRGHAGDPSVPWPADAAQLRAAQRHLATLAPPAWQLTAGARVGACFICFAEDPEALAAAGEPAWAAAVTFDEGRRVAAAVVSGLTRARYQAGLLALRCGPLLEQAVASLPQRPEVLLVNGTGRDHPRRAGLALHLGAALDAATVGVTDRPLLTQSLAFGVRDAALDALPLKLGGAVVAYFVETRPGARGVVAHGAWRTDPLTALTVVRAATAAGRTPAPLREARRLARTARAADRGEAPYPPSDPPPLAVTSSDGPTGDRPWRGARRDAP
jgi:deoxyribonuclease V